jgi:hypothetical protein
MPAGPDLDRERGTAQVSVVIASPVSSLNAPDPEAAVAVPAFRVLHRRHGVQVMAEVAMVCDPALRSR